MDKRQAKLIAYGAAADILFSAGLDFFTEEYSEADAEKIKRQLLVIIRELDRRALRTEEFS